VPIRIGDIVGDYLVIDAIGAGGMGSVFRVEHRITRRVEAMKALSSGIGISPAEVERFEREIRLQARLQHPNIAAVYSAVQHGDLLALVMEHVEGESLESRLARGRLPLATALAIAADVLAALDCAHRHGVVHGDVSPANVLITPSGSAKLTDFGLARDDSSGRGSGIPVGTAAYMSPEQVRGAGLIDARSDLYSTGVVLYEMLTGRKPFNGESAFEIMRGHVETAPELPGKVDPSLPPSLDRVLEKALAKDPAQRLQTAAAFREALQRCPARRRRPRRRVWLEAAVVSAAAIGCAAILRPARVHAPAPPPPPVPVILAAPPAPVVEPKVVEPKVETPPAEVEMPKPTTTRAKPGPRAAAAASPATVNAPPAPAAVERAVELPPAPAPADLPAPPMLSHPSAVPSPDIPISKPEAPKAQKQGNRFVRALGKINPFRRSSKPEDAKDQ
jgi:serine/threonine-protein kinase